MESSRYSRTEYTKSKLISFGTAFSTASNNHFSPGHCRSPLPVLEILASGEPALVPRVAQSLARVCPHDSSDARKGA